jgi:hypothetical protein
MSSQITSLISVVFALIAVCIAVWQVRSNVERAKKANVLDAISQSIGEFRSESFRGSMRNLLSNAPKSPPGRFDEISADWREDAYTICYFFEYIAAFIGFDIIEGNLIISLMGSQIIQAWVAMEPFTESERRYREQTYPPDASIDFLPHFEWLVGRIRELGGSRAPSRLRSRFGVQPRRPLPAVQAPAAEQSPSVLGRSLGA